MVFDVLPIRKQGKAIVRWQIATQPRIRASVEIRDERDEALARTLKVAVMVPLDRDVPALPTLKDPQLLPSQGGRWVLTGWERVDAGTIGTVDYAQTWLLEAPPLER